jgi:hypothetical protein
MAARVWPVDAVSGSPSYTGRALRQTGVSPFVGQATGSRPLGGLSGVRPGTPTSIATASSTTWTVTPFLGVIDGEAAAIAGVYAYSFDSNQTGSVTAAAGSARVDRLDVQISDPAESDGTSTPGVAIVYTAGTPGGGAPSAPARSHPLVLINVPATGGGSPTVSWIASYYAGPGGFVPFNTLTGLQAWTTPPPAQHATVINDGTTSNNGDWVWQGSAWTRATPFAVAQGTGSIAGIGAGSSANVTLTFPTGRFTVAPFVYAIPGSSRLTPGFSSISTTGATINWGNWSTGAAGSTTFNWFAVQMTPGTADG